MSPTSSAAQALRGGQRSALGQARVDKIDAPVYTRSRGEVPGRGRALDEVLMHVNGANGQVELYADRVHIARRGLLGFLGYGRHADRDIPLAQIRTVDLSGAGFLSGYILFVSFGQQIGRGGLPHVGPALDIVIFGANRRKSFEEFKHAVEKRLEELRNVPFGRAELEQLLSLRKQR